MEKKTILITGGAGFIGSQVNLLLNDAGYETVILDNLSTGDAKAVLSGTLITGDLKDSELLNHIFSTYPIAAVIHFAALTDVGESVRNPAIYYATNVTATLNLLDAMMAHGVKKLIFSSSAAVYGIPTNEMVTENSPTLPINPYGETKLIVEKVLRDYRIAYGLEYCCLRYFNAAGGDPSGKLKHFKKKENNLIPLVLNAIKAQGTITVNGTDYPTSDGTCLRDYIHVADLGLAHIQALQKLFTGKVAACYNLGNGKGFTVNEVIKASEEVTGQKVETIFGPRRDGDPPILLANAQKAFADLGWQPQYPELHTIIEDAWKARQK